MNMAEKFLERLKEENPEAVPEVFKPIYEVLKKLKERGVPQDRIQDLTDHWSLFHRRLNYRLQGDR